MMLRSPLAAAALLATFAVAGCSVDTKSDADTAAAVTPAPAPATPPIADSGVAAMPTDTAGAMRVEVDISARKAYVSRGGAVDTIAVAVGSQRWPTQTGEWTIKQVVFNPEWVPPDESWADEREPRQPGDPKNPLGRAQLVYDAPRSIHGTNAPASIGTATSHGSIRMRNEDILRLAREVLVAGGAPKDDAWLQRAESNRTEKQIVDLPRPVAIRVF